MKGLATLTLTLTSLLFVVSCMPLPRAAPTPSVIEYVEWECDYEANVRSIPCEAWLDHNANGIRDPEDTPLEGFQFRIYHWELCDRGHYERLRPFPEDPKTFDHLLGGQVVAPPGYTLTTEWGDIEKWERDGFVDLGFALVEQT